MIIIQEPKFSSFAPCAYLEDKKWRFKYLFATDLSEEELDQLLSTGWRKFGIYYFRPDCLDCFKCVPIRVPVNEFKPSKGQRRVLRKGNNIKVRFGPLEYKQEIYELYRIHSIERFDNDTDEEDFLSSFYMESCPALQSEFYLEGKMIAAGFLDRSCNALSSVYFVYDTKFSTYSPGTLGALMEIEYARKLGLKYYYLGYYVKENHSMSYKASFRPYELFDWHAKNWTSAKK